MARATAKDDRLRLTTGFSTGQPLVAAAVRLVPPDGSDAIELGRTDAHGQLDFRLPDQASATWELQVDGGPGHRDYLELPGITARALPKPAPRGELAYATRQLGLLAVLGCFGLGGLAFGRRRT
jgi:nickel transport protein